MEEYHYENINTLGSEWSDLKDKNDSKKQDNFSNFNLFASEGADKNSKVFFNQASASVQKEENDDFYGLLKEEDLYVYDNNEENEEEMHRKKLESEEEIMHRKAFEEEAAIIQKNITDALNFTNEPLNKLNDVSNCLLIGFLVGIMHSSFVEISELKLFKIQQRLRDMQEKNTEVDVFIKNITHLILPPKQPISDSEIKNIVNILDKGTLIFKFQNPLKNHAEALLLGFTFGSLHKKGYDLPDKLYDKAKKLFDDEVFKDFSNDQELVFLFSYSLLNLEEDLKREQAAKLNALRKDEEMKREIERQCFSNEVLNQTCNICLEEFNVLSMANAFLDCGCILHIECFRDFIEAGISTRDINFTCPNTTCKKEIHPKIIMNTIKDNKALLEKYEKFEMSNYMLKNNKDVSCCPTPNCDYLFVYVPSDGSHRFDCPVCKRNYCLKCKVPYHQGDTCEEFYFRNNRAEIEKKQEDEFFKLVKSFNYKACPNCHAFVDRISGCDHMNCRCGTLFCYRCGVAEDHGTTCTRKKPEEPKNQPIVVVQPQPIREPVRPPPNIRIQPPQIRVPKVSALQPKLNERGIIKTEVPNFSSINKSKPKITTKLDQEPINQKQSNNTKPSKPSSLSMIKQLKNDLKIPNNKDRVETESELSIEKLRLNSLSKIMNNKSQVNSMPTSINIPPSTNVNNNSPRIQNNMIDLQEEEEIIYIPRSMIGDIEWKANYRISEDK